MLVPKYDVVDEPSSYLERQIEVAARAAGVNSVPCHIDYTDEEHATWSAIQSMLRPLWDQHAAMPLRLAQNDLDLPSTHIPQLSAVTERLQPLTGFRYAAVPGTVPGHDFFGALADRVFSSTQFIRWSGSPLYTPRPDVVHEIGGHAVALANPQLAELHRLAGLASMAAPSMLTPIAAVFWYSIEFGVIAGRHGWNAYGTGLLSSPGELAWFADNAEIRPLDIGQMISTPYDINQYQPVLFGAASLDHVVEAVGGFYRDIIRQSTICDAQTALCAEKSSQMSDLSV